MSSVLYSRKPSMVITFNQAQKIPPIRRGSQQLPFRPQSMSINKNISDRAFLLKQSQRSHLLEIRRKIVFQGRPYTPFKSSKSLQHAQQININSGINLTQIPKIGIANALYLLDRCCQSCKEAIKLNNMISIEFDKIVINTYGKIDAPLIINKNTSPRKAIDQKKSVNYLIESIKKISNKSFNDFYTYYVRSSNRMEICFKIIRSLIKSYTECSKIKLSDNISSTNYQNDQTQVIPKSSKRNRNNKERHLSHLIPASQISLLKSKTHRLSGLILGMNKSKQRIHTEENSSPNYYFNKDRSSNSTHKIFGKEPQICHQFNLVINQQRQQKQQKQQINISKNKIKNSYTSYTETDHTTKDSNSFRSNSNIQNEKSETIEYAGGILTSGTFNAFTPSKCSSNVNSSNKLMNFESVFNQDSIEEVISQGSCSDQQQDSQPKRNRIMLSLEQQTKLNEQIRQNQHKILSQNCWTKKFDTILDNPSELKQSFAADTSIFAPNCSNQHSQYRQSEHPFHMKQTVQSFIQDPYQLENTNHMNILTTKLKK